jgi:transposase
VVRKPEDYEARVRDFQREIIEHKRKGRPIVFVDETGFDERASPLKGYAKKGSRLYISSTSGSWTRVSVAAAISEDGAVMTTLRNGSFSSTSFSKFLGDLNLPQGTVVLMDNVAFHKSRTVQHVIDYKGWSSVFTPPYSPWFNPIENVFGIVQNHFRRLRVEDSDVKDERVSSIPLTSSMRMSKQIQDAFDTAASTCKVANCVRRFWRFVSEKDIKDTLVTPR